MSGRVTVWNTVLDRMAEGECPLPARALHRKVPFMWRTSCLLADESSGGAFAQTLTPCARLRTPQNYHAFRQQLSNAAPGAACVSFPNLSGDTILVVPTPRRGKVYTTLREFLAHAPVEQQRELWKEVARQARAALKKNARLWISTHGIGVAYLHVRICSRPKYYKTSALAVCGSLKARNKRTRVTHRTKRKGKK